VTNRATKNGEDRRQCRAAFYSSDDKPVTSRVAIPCGRTRGRGRPCGAFIVFMTLNNVLCQCVKPLPLTQQANAGRSGGVASGGRRAKPYAATSSPSAARQFCRPVRSNWAQPSAHEADDHLGSSAALFQNGVPDRGSERSRCWATLAAMSEKVASSPIGPSCAPPMADWNLLAGVIRSHLRMPKDGASFWEHHP
jgi:hypothetical protein